MTKTYQEAMEELNVAAYAALRAAGNEDGAPVDALWTRSRQRSTA
jgi:hypothetical protein